MTALLGAASLADQVELVARAVGGTSDRSARAVRRLAGAAPTDSWHGEAAATAAWELHSLRQRTERLATDQAAATDVLRVCARALREAEALRRRAQQLMDPHGHAAEQLTLEAAELSRAGIHRAAVALYQLVDTVSPRARRSLGDQLLGFGRGAVGSLWSTAVTGYQLLPVVAAADPAAWWSRMTQLAAGAGFAAQHPAQAVAGALDLDTLQSGAYGEWLGALSMDAILSFPSGGASAASRTAKAVREAGELAQVAAHVAAGGAVRVRGGLRLPAGFPSTIRDLTAHRRRHILDGDGPRSGGHRAGTGKPGKTEFPASWSDDEIIRRVMNTAMHPQRVTSGRQGRFEATGTVEGVTVRVILDRSGAIITAYPLSGGRGVIDNPRLWAQ